MTELFANPLKELKSFEDLTEWLNRGQGPVRISGVLDSQKVHLLSSLRDIYSWQLIVTASEQRAQEICDDYRLFEKNVWYYPAKDLIFYSADVQGSLITKRRLSVLRHMMEEDRGVVVTTIDGLMNLLSPFDAIEDSVIDLEPGDECSPGILAKRLVAMGYEASGQADEPGEFCLRGGILDVYSLTEETPWRIEFWGDEIDSIRTYDPESQRSVDPVDSIRIFPSSELLIHADARAKAIRRIGDDAKKQVKALRDAGRREEAKRLSDAAGEIVEELTEGVQGPGLESCIRYFYEKTCTFADYFPDGDTLFCLDEPVRLKEKAETVELEFRESMTQRLEKGYVLPAQADLLFGTDRLFAKLERPDMITMSGLDQKVGFLDLPKQVSFEVQNVNSYKNSFELLIKDLEGYKKHGWRVVLLSASRARGERLAKDLREYDLRAYYAEESREVQKGEIFVTYGSLKRGFAYPMLRFAVMTESDLFGTEQSKKRRRTPAYSGQKISHFSELSVGDYVVHENHGVGIYRGIEKVEMDKVVRDYIKIEYGDGGNLYIPATQFRMVQKYAGSDAKPPKLNRLGTPEWNRTKSKVRSAVREVAEELVSLYSERQAGKGFEFSPDNSWQKEFEETFPYEETQDQLDAIEATKQDMMSPKIMDRLICGDVGYGKTEIAIRAAFKAVQDGKQVAFLVPTTILAQQHFQTFTQRMKDYPVTVSLMSRFRTAKEQKETLTELKKGMVDILIGTHRILSKDVQFKDLGLLIVDEEQRFGVSDKEKIKQIRRNVDVLTLSATPIPRTLHMSLIGVRDMSVLEEAPQERTAIQTYVLEYNPEMVREAITRELARDGQVYYVYNRVRDIGEITAKIQEMVPDANVACAHGQMSERELERIMMDFINHEIDVLVSTTIIETGLDIPNTNTIIIHDADRYGLSQLYQLRGRVGRSNRTAYAFIMYRRDKILNEVAQKRLEAIREFTELGSGIRIAMRDLEIRGAGSILGEYQHGHMEAVGYDLYCKMLNQEVMALKGGAAQGAATREYETEIDLNIDAFIPASYIKNESQKLDFYKRIGAIENDDEAMDMRDELIDRFGDIPKPVENLLQISCIRSLAENACITAINGSLREIQLVMYPKANVRTEGLPGLLASYRNMLKIKAGEDGTPMFLYQDRTGTTADTGRLLQKLKELIAQIESLIIRS